MAYFAASCDTVEDNTKFAESLELDFPILSDPGREVAGAYGVVNEEREWPFRYTFYIGEDGKVLHVDKEVKPMTAGEDVTKKLEELGIARR